HGRILGGRFAPLGHGSGHGRSRRGRRVTHRLHRGRPGPWGTPADRDESPHSRGNASRARSRRAWHPYDLSARLTLLQRAAARARFRVVPPPDPPHLSHTPPLVSPP